jgi:Uma2 family endonuclease
LPEYPKLDIDPRGPVRYRTLMASGAIGTPLGLRRWTRIEYERLVRLGTFAGEPLELIGGQLIIAEPQYPYHASGVTRADYAIRAGLPPGWIVRIQAPVALGDDSEPEPDLAVVRGAPDDYSELHPSRPALIVEVADSSLAFDRASKGSLYARAGVEDYWIVNLVDRVLEVYRDPLPDPRALHGWRYGTVTTLAPPATAVPLALPSTRVAVAELLPLRPPAC